MIVAVVEDEPLVARRIERLTREILQEKLTKIVVKNSLPEAMQYVFRHPIDLLLLDLNLHGKDGFELLKQAVSGSFHTIIISAHTDKAVEAFEYGVLDFLGKPFTRERLSKALSRFDDAESKNIHPAKYIAVRKSGKLLLIHTEQINFIRGAGIYSEIVLKNGTVELHDKSLNRLNAVLSSNFIRTHKSYIVNLRNVISFSTLGGSKYTVELHTGEVLPVSRTKYKKVKALFSR
jgi:two-component system response regulator LytT